MLPSTSHPLHAGRTGSSTLVRAARGERSGTRPVWFMRQAGRSLPEYRASRAGTEMLDACLRPELAAEITLQPVRRHGVDAAVFFSDIVVPVLLAGVPVEIVPGRGPVFADPIRTPAAVAALPPVDESALAPIADAVRIVVDELGETPLIGFAGAPYTLASYLIEGGPSKEQLRTRALMHSDPATWSALLTWCADVSGAFLRAQVLAGASVVQLFDSWAGSLSRSDYETSVVPFSRRALDAVAGWTSHASTSGWVWPRCSIWHRAWAPTWSASTGACRWMRRHDASGGASPCRATSTPRCWAHHGRCSKRTCATCSAAVMRRPRTSSISAMVCPRKPTRRC